MRIGLALVLGLALQTSAGAQPTRAPGQLIDVGGWKLHLNCTGGRTANAPLVVLESGSGDFSVEWSLVQPGIAKTGRVCSYDRAGDGWSEMGPHPRTFKQIVYELHTLLERAGERPPYLLVGHSYGGWLVRAYRSAFPSDVAGMLLLDPGEDDPDRLLPDGSVARASALATDATIPPVQTNGPLRIADIPADALAAIRRDLAASPPANEPPRDLLPQDAQMMRTWALAQVGHIVAGVNPVQLEEIALLRRERVENPQAYGDLPLVVVTRGLPDPGSPAAREEQHRAAHQAIASASRQGKWLTADRSGHHIQLQQPDLVIGAVSQLLAAGPTR